MFSGGDGMSGLLLISAELLTGTCRESCLDNGQIPEEAGGPGSAVYPLTHTHMHTLARTRTVVCRCRWVSPHGKTRMDGRALG